MTHFWQCRQETCLFTSLHVLKQALLMMCFFQWLSPPRQQLARWMYLQAVERSESCKLNSYLSLVAKSTSGFNWPCLHSCKWTKHISTSLVPRHLSVLDLQGDSLSTQTHSPTPTVPAEHSFCCNMKLPRVSAWLPLMLLLPSCLYRSLLLGAHVSWLVLNVSFPAI